ncbi:MAG: hypothetical protein KKE30_00860 [Gammaproteobacteria bacterium]|nr:hypothetical protein [Gammaproteobacteria bacterium]MBU1556422.1 hypothetical protein [Gammaproteobacteria bacterium]MBU2071994.1 hypothetical protein [Gammaproteobacteria bacterium]MBU2183921.1 hypothetical protein [Gammaproteobacteria bacterium]MBU2203325.1 hypothetical protein [Gammaproteobacteria bacterium]
MLIDKLLFSRRLRVQQLTEQGAELQHNLQCQQRLLQQRALVFIGSAPGLMLSYSAGVVFSLRHSTVVKTVRSAVGLRWLSWAF